MVTTNSKAKGGKGKKEKAVVYPEVGTEARWGDDPLYAEDCKQRLGWTYDEKEARDAGIKEPLFEDRLGKPVYCLNNLGNRPFYVSNATDLMQKILNRRWAGPNGNGKSINGEPIILSKYAEVVNGQHTMAAVVWAEQERLGPKSAHWAEKWPGPVCIDKLVVYGVDSDEETKATMDSCKPRSLADVLYTHPLFQAMDPSPRKTCVKVADFAIKFLWQRTGLDRNAFNPRRTHEEAVAYLVAHPHLMEAIKHVYEEYTAKGKGEDLPGWKNNNVLFGAGYAAGMMYLMGCSGSVPAKYHDLVRDGSPTEGKGKKALLDWGMWDQAMDFWTAFACADPIMKDVRVEVAMTNDPDTGGGGSLAEKTCILSKAWHVFLNTQGKKVIKESQVKPQYKMSRQGYRVLDEYPTVGGIDLGDPGKNKTKPKEETIKEEQEASDEPAKPKATPTPKAPVKPVVPKGKGPKTSEEEVVVPIQEEDEDFDAGFDDEDEESDIEGQGESSMDGDGDGWDWDMEEEARKCREEHFAAMRDADYDGDEGADEDE